MKKALLFLFSILLFSHTAYAIDNTSTFGGNDKDRDGFDDTHDCDDTNFQVIPGYNYPCDAGSGPNTGYKACQSNGTYSACIDSSTTPLCEKTAAVGSRCLYVDPNVGSDTTGNGSYALPWATLKCVSYFASGAPGCNTDAAPGSVVYMKGSGTYSSTFDVGDGDTGHSAVLYSARAAQAGTSTDPVIIKRYPGSSINWQCAGSAGNARLCVDVESANDIIFDDIKKTTSSGYGSMFFIASSARNAITRSDLRNQNGDGNNNLAALNSTQNTNFTFKHNYVLDIADAAGLGNIANVSGVVFFNDNVGGGHTVEYNRIGYSVAPGLAGNIAGSPIKFKHGAAYDPSNLNVVAHNIAFNFHSAGISSNTSGMRVYDNLIVGGLDHYGPCLVQFQDAPNYAENLEYYSNTCVGAPLYTFYSGMSTYPNGIGPITISNNINVDDKTYVGDSFGISYDQYGTDAQYSQMIASGITEQNNCLWNSTASGYKVGMFAWNGTAGGTVYGPTWTALATMQAYGGLGLGVGEFWQDAALNSNYMPTNPNCVGKGWSSGVTVTPTPTPSPTATSTPSPTATPTVSPTPTPTPTPSGSGAIGTYRMRDDRR